MTTRAYRNFKIGFQVVFGWLYPSELEFSKSEVIFLRHDLREALQLLILEHLGNFKIGNQVDFTFSICQGWNFQSWRSFVSVITSNLVDFGLLYPSELEFSKSEVICLRYYLREVQRLPWHLETSKLVIR